eukprot:CAMPEP_0195308814 /NCGR_PEP_ID=MMETSP0707-20130614/38422_1 /TAXON_ID=33640 /ORGANISM="Asterionellopsis glacialis, Strain CCMP134" /LENGTH=703 /DNA_ID=CAMNT_0040373101 /DNA_START=114 /DNA_END=2226 /DNA_ORIENTATION=-
MKFATLALIASISSVPLSSAFSPSWVSTLPSKAFGVEKFHPSSKVQMGGDDDWYSDYDPSKWEPSADNSNYGGSRDGGRGGGGGYNSRGRSGGGGGGRRSSYGGGHDYTRDTSRDSSNVDEDAVNALLAERVNAKRSRNFEEADAIRDQLLEEYHVGVYDRERTWRTGCSTSGSGMRRGGGAGRGGGGGGGGRFGGGAGRGRGPRRERNFGPNGHDYELSSDAGPNQTSLADEEIHGLIAERLQAKLNRDFNTADRIQVDLLDSGVYVHDGMKEWRADGVPFGDFDGRGGKPGRMSGSHSDRNRPYAKSAYSLEFGGDEQQIADLLAERTKYKTIRDYNSADRIREDLLENYDVHIDDRIREWSIGGNFGDEHNQQRAMSQAMSSRGYVKSQSSANLSPEDEEFVQNKVDERSEAKKSRNFDLADSIRDDLLDEYNVVIQDKLRQWSVGGDFGDDMPGNRRNAAYVRRGGGDLSDEDVAVITSMIEERSQAKRNREYDIADDIRDTLRNKYEISIDDRSKEWRVDSDDYVRSPLGGNEVALSDDDVSLIQAKLGERAILKRNRDYEEADAIRDELREEFSVYIDDRTKEWKTVAEEDGNNDRFVAEAQSSQSSAYKRKEKEEEFDDEFDSIFYSNSDEVLETETVAELSEEIQDSDDSADAPPSVESRDDLMSLTVVQLKEKLKDSGLPVSGKKAELVDRLLA